MYQEADNKLTKASVDLMRHEETRAYIGVMRMGKVSIVDNIRTACTDGVNEKYSMDFIMKLPLPEMRGVRLHEVLHKALKHTVRCLPYWRKNPKLANIAADYVVNDVIMNLKDKAFIKLPDCALYDPQFHDWSFPEIYRHLEKEEQEGDKGGKRRRGSGRGDPLDEHDMSGSEEMSAEEIKQHIDEVNEAIRQGEMIAGRFGKTLPRAITDSLHPPVDWATALREYMVSVAQGSDEHTYRKFDKRALLDDIIQPGTMSEKVGDIVTGIDVSGSIDDDLLTRFGCELQAICEQVQPDALRVLWWDTKVRSEQVFTPDQFGDIARLLKPVGGGGTRAGCVSKYLIEKQAKCDCLIMLTDGVLEDNVEWDVTAPTLWLVTSNKSFVPPRGGTVIQVNE